MKAMTIIIVAALTSGCAIVEPTSGDDRKPRLFSATIDDPSTIRVIDGYTIDLGWSQHIRLLGFDSPEIQLAECPGERELGKEASIRLRQLIDKSATINLTFGFGRDQFERVLGYLILDERNSGEFLIEEGLARPYDGGEREPWC